MEEVLQEWNNLAEQVEIANKAALANVTPKLKILNLFGGARHKNNHYNKVEAAKVAGNAIQYRRKRAFIEILREEHSEEIFYQIARINIHVQENYLRLKFASYLFKI